MKTARFQQMAFLFLLFTIALGLSVVAVLVIVFVKILGMVRSDRKLKKPDSKRAETD
jgi:hypothetical protein